MFAMLRTKYHLNTGFVRKLRGVCQDIAAVALSAHIRALELPPITVTLSAPVADATSLAGATKVFGFRLVGKLNKGEGNLCVSPVAIRARSA